MIFVASNLFFHSFSFVFHVFQPVNNKSIIKKGEMRAFDMLPATGDEEIVEMRKKLVKNFYYKFKSLKVAFKLHN
jgi:hypothetical protein